MYYYAFEGCLLAFFFVFIAFCLVLAAKGLRGREYTFFMTAVFFAAVRFFLSGRMFEALTGGSAYDNYLISFSDFIIFPVLLTFHLAVSGAKPSKNVSRTIIAFYIAPFFMAFVPNIESSYILRAVMYFVTSFIILYYAEDSRKRKVPEYLENLIGAFMLLTEIVFIFFYNYYDDLSPIIFPSLPTTVMWMFAMMTGLISRIQRYVENVHLLSRKIITAKEDERMAISRELHDGVGQDLQFIKLKLQQINSTYRDKDLETVIDTVAETVNSLREIVSGILPVPVQHLSFSDSIKAYCDKIKPVTGTGFDINIENGLDMEQALKLSVFRIFQEAVTNGTKHGGAKNFSIKAIKKGDMVKIFIMDDGSGFDVSERINTGTGLQTMQERVRMLGGFIEIDSSEGNGVRITLELPLKQRFS